MIGLGELRFRQRWRGGEVGGHHSTDGTPLSRRNPLGPGASIVRLSGASDTSDRLWCLAV
jgi:hypothetical protein